MKITKFGHCCLLIEENGARILTDPGIFSTAQNEAEKVHALLITHEHADHYHLPSVREILAKNPEVKIYTNKAVGKLLDAEKIPYALIEHGESQTIQTVLVEGFGREHAPIYPPLIPEVQNTGYFIAGKLWYPGDAFFDPGRRPEILALPVSAPWLHIRESLDYLKLMKPRVAFPVHDGFLREGGVFHRLPGMVAREIGAEFRVLGENKETEL